MSARKGSVKTGGRKKGSRNKITVTIKDTVVRALAKAGGVDYLVEQSRENPTAFMTLLSKLIPTTVAGDADNPIRHTVTMESIVKAYKSGVCDRI